jgi:hypothetical protein
MSLFRRALSLAALAAAFLASSPAAYACSVCGCGDPLLDASDPAASMSKLRLQLDSEYIDVKAGNEDDPSQVDRLKQYTLKLQGVYTPTSRLSVVATVPFTRKELNALGSTSIVNGIGDVEVAARYSVFDQVDLAARRRQTFGVSLGTSLPTGSNDATDAGGARIDEHGQVGTGSWGPFAGLHYRFAQDSWQALASVTGRLHNTNSHDYRYGSAVLWSIHGQYQPLKRLAFDLGLDGRFAERDHDTTRLANGDSELVPSTGGTVLAIAPGAFWNVSGPLWFSVRAQFPVYTRLFDVQDVNPTIVAGFQYQLF